MKNTKTSGKNILLVIILAVLAIVSVRMDGRPNLHTSLIFAYFLVFLMGIFSNYKIALPAGGIGIGLGILARKLYPQVVEYKGARIEEAAMYKDFLSTYWWLLIVGALVVAAIGVLAGQKIFDQGREIRLSNKAVANIGLVVLIFIAGYSVRISLLGLILAYFAVLFMGFIASRGTAMLAGGLSIGLGYLAHLYFPKLSDAEAYTSYASFIESNWWLLIIGGIIIALVGNLISSQLAKNNIKGLTTRQITYMAIFVALSVAINTVRIGSVSFGGFPIILSGYLLGPLAGFIVGGVADLVGFIVRPSSFGFNPIFTLTSALTGAIPVLITTKLLKDRYPKFTLWKVLLGIFIGQFSTSVIIVPIFQVLLYGQNTFWFFATRAAIKQIVSIPFYAFFTVSLSDRLTKIINFREIGHARVSEKVTV